MNWAQKESNPLEQAGYEKERCHEEVAAADASTDRIVCAAEDKIIKITRHADGVSANELTLPVEGTVDDIALGQTSDVYLLSEGDLKVVSTAGVISGRWAENMVQIVAPSEEKFVVGVDKDGSIKGFEGQNGLPKFDPIEFRDATGAVVEPTVVAGRSGFTAHGGSMVRSYDAQGNVEWEATFDADVQCVGLFSTGGVVGLTNGTIVWINDDGDEVTDLDGDLTSISPNGQRLLLGSADGALTAFGNGGLTREMADGSATRVVQTTDDYFIGVADGETINLFSRQRPPSRVSATRSNSGTALTAGVKNPFPIPLRIRILVDGADGNQLSEEELFIPSQSNEEENIPLPEVSGGDEISVEIRSEDGSIVAFDDEVMVEADAPTPGETQEDTPTASEELIEAPSAHQNPPSKLRSQDMDSASGSEDSKTRSAAGGADEPGGTGNQLRLEADQTTVGDADESHGVDGRVGPAEQTSGVSVSLEPVRVEDSKVKWTIRVENHTDNRLHNPVISKTKPVKFTADGRDSLDNLPKGNTFETSAFSPLRSGTVEVTVEWDAPDGGRQKRTERHTIPANVFEADATYKRENDRTRLEFSLINRLGVPIHDTLKIRSIGEESDPSIGCHPVTLNPGPNLLTKILTPDDPQSQGEGTYELCLESLCISDETDAIPAPIGGTASESNRTISRNIGVKVSDDRHLRTADIERSSASQPKANILVETVRITNHGETWLPSTVLRENDDAGRTGTGQVIPALAAGESIELVRYWQATGDPNTLDVRIPACRFSETAKRLSSEEIRTPHPKATVRSGFIRNGPAEYPELFVAVENHSNERLELVDIVLGDDSPDWNVERFTVDGEDVQYQYFQLPDGFDPGRFDGLIRSIFEMGEQTHTCGSIMVDRTDVPLDRSSWWFEPSVTVPAQEDRSGDRVDITVTNTNETAVEDVTVTRWNASGFGTRVSSLPGGASLTHQTPLMPDGSSGLVPPEPPVYEVSATVDGDDVSSFIEVHPDRSADREEYEVRVLPTRATIDEEALSNSWPDQIASEWHLRQSSTEDRFTADEDR